MSALQTLALLALTIDPASMEGIPLDDQTDGLDVAGRATWDLLDRHSNVIETVEGSMDAVAEHGQEIGAVEMVELDSDEIGRLSRDERKERRENEGGIIRRTRRKSLEKRLDNVNERQDKRIARRDDDDDDDGDSRKEQSVNKSAIPSWLPKPPQGTRWERSSITIAAAAGGAGSASYSQMVNGDMILEKVNAVGSLAGSILNYIQQGDEFLYTPTGGAPVETFTADGDFSDQLKGKRLQRGLNLTANVTVTGAGNVRWFFQGYIAKQIPCN